MVTNPAAVLTVMKTVVKLIWSAPVVHAFHLKAVIASVPLVSVKGKMTIIPKLTPTNTNMPNLIHIKRQCRQCHETTTFSLDQDALARWQSGELIQNAFPHLSTDQRELLISGTCGKCFDALFAEPKGWPGDGSGEDDLADMNQNEADNYREE